MNIPVYAAALIVFVIALDQFESYLLITLALCFAGMAVVLLVQAGLRRSKPAPTASSDLSASEAQAALRDARRAVRVDGLITISFTGVSWAIFTYLAPGGVRLLGPGWTYSQTGASGAPAAELALVLGGLALGVLAVSVLWYFDLEGRAKARAAAFRAKMIDVVPPGTPVECQFDNAYRYAIADGPPPSSDHPLTHSGDLRFFTLLARTGGLTDRFALCRPHSAVFLRIEAFGRFVIARK